MRLTISGFTVPALSTRKAETEFELQDGQSFVIAGLIDNRVTNPANKIPGLGDIPILGNFFKSKSAQKSNSELMVLCTAHRISPSTQTSAVAGISQAVHGEGEVRREETGGRQQVRLGERGNRTVVCWHVGNLQEKWPESMPELSVVIIAQDNEQRAVLQVLVDGTSVARVVHISASFPSGDDRPRLAPDSNRKSGCRSGRHSRRQSRLWPCGRSN